MGEPALDQLAGFRRRFRITPQATRVCCEVEDDYHCMMVIVEHDGQRATAILPDMRRAPWTTCPGAERQLQDTFTGLPLAEFESRRSEKKSNCTHLYDLAILAASHAQDGEETVYDILVSDPVDGKRLAELRKNGSTVMSWAESEFKMTEPAELEGMMLYDLKSWIGTLAPEQQEYARLLQWGNMLANGRSYPIELQSDATKLPPNCYTFQPEQAKTAKRVGEIKDFSRIEGDPLDGYQAFL